MINEKHMAARKAINTIRKRFHDAITDFKVVKIAILAVIPGYIGLLIIAVIVAMLSGPGGFNILDHYISDLGGSWKTPAPYLYDIACILAGILTIPFTFYVEKLFVPMPKSPEEFNKITRLRYRLGTLAFITSIIGNIGYIGVGIWSEDRSSMTIFGYTLGMHGIMSGLAFGGFQLGALFLGLILVLYDTKVPKIIGIYGIFGPITGAILYGVFGGPFLEWMMLFLILGWIIPLSLSILNKEELQLKS